MALIGDSVGQSALEACALQQTPTSANGLSKVRDIFTHGTLTYAFLACIFLTDSADLLLISRLAKSVVLDPPIAYLHATLPVFVFVPAIAATFLGSYSSFRLGRFRTLSWSAIGRVATIALFVLSVKYFDFARWQALVFISTVSALCAYAFVPRLCWMINIRKLSFFRSCHLLVLASALLASIAVAQTSISTVSLCQLALLSSAFASIGFRFLASKKIDLKPSGNSVRHMSSLIANQSLAVLTSLSLISCLAVASFGQFQSDQSSLFSFAAIACLGIVLGSALPLFRFSAPASDSLAFAFRLLSIFLLFVFGFIANCLAPPQFIFLIMVFWVASFVSEQRCPKGTVSSSVISSKVGLESSVAWGQAIVLATTFLITLATCAGIDTTSSALQLRKFALVGGVVSLISLAASWRSWVWRLKFR